MTPLVTDGLTKESALALGASESRYRRLFETAQDAILILDGDSGTIVDANPFVIHLLGYRLDELTGMQLWQLGLFRDIQESKAAFERLRKDGYIRYEDLPLETKAGKRAEVEFVSNVYEVDGCTVIQCNIRDITARKAAERTAQESNERFRFLAESMPQMVFTARPNGDVDYFNQQWSAFTGFSFDEIKDWRWTRFIHPDDLPETVARWSHSLATGEPFEFQHRFRHKDGVHRWHLSRACAMRDAGGAITMWISSNTDIDDQKRIQDDLSRLYKQAESLNRSKDEFLATISHELRTPITSVLGWAELLTMNTLDDATRRDGIATILSSARTQARLIDDVLDVSRMITGKLHLTVEPIDMESVLTAALTAIMPAANAKNIKVCVNAQPRLIRIGGDAVRLQQVFWNLLSNALKFTPAGGRVDIRLYSHGSMIVVEVQDTGIGITPEFLPYAFDRFAQQEGGAKRHGGMGIGLSIVKQLVELHGGTVAAASKGVGRGAILTVSFPAAATSQEHHSADAAHHRHASTGGLHLVSADGEPESREPHSRVLISVDGET
jgi:PAS domain S-box-containing protein